MGDPESPCAPPRSGSRSPDGSVVGVGVVGVAAFLLTPEPRLNVKLTAGGAAFDVKFLADGPAEVWRGVVKGALTDAGSIGEIAQRLRAAAEFDGDAAAALRNCAAHLDGGEFTRVRTDKTNVTAKDTPTVEQIDFFATTVLKRGTYLRSPPAVSANTLPGALAFVGGFPAMLAAFDPSKKP
ncbi:hypothetical protein M885DRAFT_574070 [Pelagophyceae sp. CCMP2097]|nr:hypothetical protein M885DRAFT_574070 [Pelagophyceae sp. CCMP2097]